MATTKRKIAEQVQRLLKGNPIIQARVHINDIKLLVEQLANQILKADYLSINMPEGDSLPSNCMIFTYDNIAVSTYKTTLSKCTLPSIPLSLPRNMGVFHISKTDSINEPFVPIPSGMYGIIQPQNLLGDLSGLIGYEVYGKDVVFTKNLPGLGINSVFIRLIGVDLGSLTDYDLLPLSSDMEAQIVQQAYSIFIQAPPADKEQNLKD
jgi:hypothetical protein